MRGKSCPKLFPLEFATTFISLEASACNLCLEVIGVFSGAISFSARVSSFVFKGGEGIGGAGPKVGDTGTLARLVPEMERLPPTDLLLLQYIKTALLLLIQ